MMLIVQLKLETRQLWGNNGKDETTATFFFYKNLITKKDFFQNLTFRHFRKDVKLSDTFRTVLAPRTSVRCISPKKIVISSKCNFCIFRGRKKLHQRIFPFRTKVSRRKFFKDRFFSRESFSGT